MESNRDVMTRFGLAVKEYLAASEALELATANFYLALAPTPDRLAETLEPLDLFRVNLLVNELRMKRREQPRIVSAAQRIRQMFFHWPDDLESLQAAGEALTNAHLRIAEARDQVYGFLEPLNLPLTSDEQARADQFQREQSIPITDHGKKWLVGAPVQNIP